MIPSILTDLTKCIGCEACAMACREVNELPRDGKVDRLSASTWAAVEHRGGIHVRRHCMHCLDPACVSVCPVGALRKSAEGPVIYDEDRCMGCRYCMLACPFDVPTYEWDEVRPRVRKCVLCYERRLAGGREPACTSACPTGATIFGDRDELLVEARSRIAAHPGRYVDHVYGLEEAGGTSVLYLSSVSFESLGLPTPSVTDPYPRLTWDVLSRLPQVVSVAGVLMAGIWWISSRRELVAREERTREEEPPGGSPLVADPEFPRSASGRG